MLSDLNANQAPKQELARAIGLRGIATVELARKILSATLVIIIGIRIAVVAQTSNAHATRRDEIFASIEQQFSEDPRWRDIKVELTDGYMRLSGSVVLLEDARHATKRVTESDHFSGVISQIGLRAPKVPDGALRNTAEKKIRDMSSAIQLRVRHGVVKIKGSVASQKQREDILSIVCSISGVKGVEDSMQVRGTEYPRP